MNMPYRAPDAPHRATEAPRILVAGIGNLFLGDDGFGVETARRLAERPLPQGVQVADYGIRGLDLAYALLEPYDAVIFIDIATRGEPPGTLYLIEPNLPSDGVATLDAHGMDPVKVLKLARSLGAPPTRSFVVGCEPGFLPPPDSEDVVMALSEPVQAAIEGAVQMVVELIATITTATASPETKFTDATDERR
jgi:hydrogenase maturation protease